MTVSVGTWNDIKGRREQPIDRNPSIACHGCSKSYKWQDYWKERIVDGDRVDNPNSDEPWRCDSCHEAHEQMQRRLKNNHKLDRYQ